MDHPESTHRMGRIEQTFLAWFCMLGTDFLFHAGFLHDHYLAEIPFLLPQDDAFRFIPLGYASFLVMAALVVWLIERQDVRGWKEGTAFGLVFGCALSVASYMGLASITTAPISLLVGWGIGQTTQIGLAAAVVGAARAAKGRRKLWGLALGWCVFSIVVAITLQNVG